MARSEVYQTEGLRKKYRMKNLLVGVGFGLAAFAALVGIVEYSKPSRQQAASPVETRSGEQTVYIVVVCSDLSGSQQHLGYGLGLVRQLASSGLNRMMQMASTGGFSRYCHTGTGPKNIPIVEVKSYYTPVEDYLDGNGRGALLVRPVGNSSRDVVLVLLSE